MACFVPFERSAHWLYGALLELPPGRIGEYKTVVWVQTGKLDISQLQNTDFVEKVAKGEFFDELSRVFESTQPSTISFGFHTFDRERNHQSIDKQGNIS